MMKEQPSPALNAAILILGLRSESTGGEKELDTAVTILGQPAPEQGERPSSAPVPLAVPRDDPPAL